MFDLLKSKENIKTPPRNYSSNELGEKSGWNCLLVSVSQTPNKWTRNVAPTHTIIYDICMDIHQTCQCFLILYLWGLQPSKHPCGIIGVSLDSLMASSHLKLKGQWCVCSIGTWSQKCRKWTSKIPPKATSLARTFHLPFVQISRLTKIDYTTFTGCCLFGAVPKSRDSKLLHELDAGDVLRHSPEGLEHLRWSDWRQSLSPRWQNS